MQKTLHVIVCPTLSQFCSLCASTHGHSHWCEPDTGAECLRKLVAKDGQSCLSLQVVPRPGCPSVSHSDTTMFGVVQHLFCRGLRYCCVPAGKTNALGTNNKFASCSRLTQPGQCRTLQARLALSLLLGYTATLICTFHIFFFVLVIYCPLRTMTALLSGCTVAQYSTAAMIFRDSAIEQRLTTHCD